MPGWYSEECLVWKESISNGSCTPRPLASVQEQANEAEVPVASGCHDGSQKKKSNNVSLGLQDLTDEEDNAETQSSMIMQDDFPPQFQLGAQICTMIKREYRKYTQLKIAVKKGWPISMIDFQQIPGHIIKWQDQLDPIVCNRSLHKQQHVWKCFEANLVEDGWMLKILAHMWNSALCSRSAILDHSCAGYYGNKGATIIEHTLIALFPAPAELTAAIWPLLLTQFMIYFMVPYVATLLITDDYSPTTVVKVHKIMVASSNPQAFLRVKLLVADDDSNQAANKLHSEQAKVQQHTPNASIGQTARLMTSEHAKANRTT
ncbi:hypothetical protein F5J12DRAFT_930108 [Pisolithus orientalis]|uniref:uncharacterized protein n=1 Tax=Pisolithus orientalis TaxID=936130 RepID=UPI002224713D|nr:uncharacterized protein F5J12DRAFT_930108 [Pisolithus orientalis]KAI5988124.1 hypothetical protein F5J12DRAFT_930108 [Pisolithus orientalis]